MRHGKLLCWFLRLLFRSKVNKLKVNLLLSCWLLNFFNALIKRDRISIVHFRRENLRSLNWCSFHKYVTPHLLTEAVVISMDKSKERNVISCDLRSFHFYRNVNFLAGLHLFANALRRSLKVITVCLDKESIFRPVVFTSISESPGLDEFFSSKKRISITEAFFNESCLVNSLLFLRLLIAFSWLRCLA